MSKNSVLIIDDEENMLDMLSISLKKEGYAAIVATNGKDGLEIAVKTELDYILCDLKMPVMDGLQFLAKAKEENIDASIIMMSAYATVDMAVKAMKMGAYDFIIKPFKVAEILCILEKAGERMQLRKENHLLRQKVLRLEKERGFSDIVGESKAITDVIQLAKRVAGYDTTVLINGESGTGKELFARGIHQLSSRCGGPFISINCGAVPENLLESEFFGHVRGAFTGAESDHKGLFEVAENGTLFLDEIGELPLSLQVKLLRVLQEREIRPVGSAKTKKINARVLAATAKNLTELAEQGKFRKDLLFRINVVDLKIPPLRNRLGDIPVLTKFFIENDSVTMNIHIRGISSEALAVLNEYYWPGNVRELKNVLEHAMIYSEDGWITADRIPDHIRGIHPKSTENPLLDTFSIKEGKARVEKYLIEKALSKTRYNKLQAAEILEISYPSLLSKIKDYKITPA